MTRVALVRRPGPRLAEGIVTHLERVPVDVELAARQHRDYRAALAGAGLDVREVEPATPAPTRCSSRTRWSWPAAARS